jgi:hypothetical protein
VPKRTGFFPGQGDLFMAKPKTPVPAWAYAIWRGHNKRHPLLMTLPRDGGKLELLIQQHGELVAMVAWLEFVTAENPIYHLEPVEHAVEGEYKNGKKHLDTGTDEYAVTIFPLAAFLKVPDGPIALAQYTVSQPGWRAAKQIKVDYHNEWFAGIFGKN